MKTHTSGFKTNIKTQGREIDSLITYTIDNEEIELGAEQLNSIEPVYESGILQSAMKELDIDSNVDIPIGTIINYKFGLKVGNAYEYLDYGNYEVYSSEKQEDTNSYKIVCYDKMLNAMKTYEDLGITYPITVREYISAICTKIGVEFANENDTFTNYNKSIPKEFYLEYDEEEQEYKSMGYTYRNVLTELAQVTASTICINGEDKLEVRYITDTHDTIDEDFLKNVNVNFGKVYGPVNSIVLSRSADTDFIYKQDEESIEENGLCEIKISDNQLLSLNNRADYLNGIYNTLNGLTYNLNDYVSTGIMYYDLCDRYNVQVGETTYSCIMFNNDSKVTQGLEEKVFTEEPEDSETDYTKSSKDQIRNNQTTLIVDKVNKEITAVVEEIGDRSSSQTTIAQDIDSINAALSQVAVISKEEEDDGVLAMTELAEMPIVELHVYPKGEYDLLNRYSAPHSLIGHYKINRPVIVFYNGDKSYQYQLPRLYYYNNTYDEFVLDNNVKKAYIIHRIGFNQQNEKYILPEEIEEDLDINTNNWVIGEGTNTIFIPGYDGTQNRLAHIKIKALIKNDLTSSFATEVYVDRSIELSEEGIMSDVSNIYATKTELGETERTLNANITQAVTDAEASINLSVSETLSDVLDEEDKVTGASIVLAVNGEGSSVKLDADHFDINGTVSANGNFQIDLEGNMTCNDANINGDLVTANGVLTNLTFPGEMWGWNFENAYDGDQAGFVGFNVDTMDYGSTAVFESFMNFSIRIPPNFIVESAKLYLRHTPMKWGNPNNQSQEQTGYCRNVKLYKVSNLGQTGFGLYASYMYIGGNTPIWGNPITNDNLTFSNSGFEEKSSSDFKNIFTASTDPQTYNVAVRTTVSKPTLSDWDSAWTTLGQYTGIMTGYAEIIGYLKK